MVLHVYIHVCRHSYEVLLKDIVCIHLFMQSYTYHRQLIVAQEQFINLLLFIIFIITSNMNHDWKLKTAEKSLRP